MRPTTRNHGRSIMMLWPRLSQGTGKKTKWWSMIKRMLVWTPWWWVQWPQSKVKRQVEQQWETITNKNNRIFNSRTTNSSRMHRAIFKLIRVWRMTVACKAHTTRLGSVLPLTSSRDPCLSWARSSNLPILRSIGSKTTFWTDFEIVSSHGGQC